VNNRDNPTRELEAAEFYALGLGADVSQSRRLHGPGVADLLDEVVLRAPPESDAELRASGAMRMRTSSRAGRSGRLEPVGRRR